MRVFSGIRASGDKTLGNYSGGFRQYVATQEQAASAGDEAFFCVVDLHSITTPFEPSVLRESTLSVGAWLIATGLVAERFNQRFGETFTVPRGVYPSEGARVRNLQEPERLMSTTRGAPQGVIRLIDEPAVIRKKFKTAVTDSGREVQHDVEGKAGISNLIEILSVATGDSITDIESRYDGAGYGQFKEDVGE